jgi:hypothetical protein
MEDPDGVKQNNDNISNPKKRKSALAVASAKKKSFPDPETIEYIRSISGNFLKDWE